MAEVISKDGTKIAYDLYGQGPALIYITGAICFKNFKPIIDDAKVFAKKFTVYNYDRRGRGDSGDVKPYSLDKELDDIEALIDASGGKACLYGHSSGAVLAMEAALRMPEKISKVLIYDASYVHTEKEKAEYAQVVKKVESLIAVSDHSKAIKTFVVGIGMPKIFSYLLPLMPGWKSMKALAPTLSYDMRMTSDLPPLNRLSKISIPLHIAYGEKSPESIRLVASQLSGSNSSFRFTEVKGQDHMVSAKIILSILESD